MLEVKKFIRPNTKTRNTESGWSGTSSDWARSSLLLFFSVSVLPASPSLVHLPLFCYQFLVTVANRIFPAGLHRIVKIELNEKQKKTKGVEDSRGFVWEFIP